jgi:hypothetical protein
MLGGALAFVGDRLLIGAPHENVGRGRARVRDAGAVLIVDVEGAVGSPTFARVLARVVRPDAPTPGDELGADARADRGRRARRRRARARTAFVFANAQLSEAVTIPPPSSDDDGFGSAVAAPDGLVAVGRRARKAARASSTCSIASPARRGPVCARRRRSPGRASARSSPRRDRVLVGAPGGATVPGRAFLFDAATGTVLQTLTADPPRPATTSARGRIRRRRPADRRAGRARRARPRRSVRRGDRQAHAQLRSVAPAEGARFGAALAVGDGRLVVGAPAATERPSSTTSRRACRNPRSTSRCRRPATASAARSRSAAGASTSARPATMRVRSTAASSSCSRTARSWPRSASASRPTRSARRRRRSDPSFWAGAPDGAGGAGYVARIDRRLRADRDGPVARREPVALRRLRCRAR